MAQSFTPDYRDIPYTHWQHRLGALGCTNAAEPWGEFVYDLDDIEQSIRTIVLTEKGSVPTAPEKCTRLLPWIDRRPEVAIPNIVREIHDALTIWEPRIIVDRVQVSREDFAHFRFPILWRVKGDVLKEIHRTLVLLPENWRKETGANLGLGGAYAA